MRLSVGANAPDFATRDFTGRAVGLQDYRGRPVLLSFYRYASCPLCNLRVRDIVRAYPRLAAQGLAVVAVFQSPSASIAEYVGRQSLPFPLVGDPQMDLYRRYGVERSWLALLKPGTFITALRALGQGFYPGRIEGPVQRTPADFLIDGRGRIAMAYYGRDLGDHLPLPAIERWLEAEHAKEGAHEG